MKASTPRFGTKKTLRSWKQNFRIRLPEWKQFIFLRLERLEQCYDGADSDLRVFPVCRNLFYSLRYQSRLMRQVLLPGLYTASIMLSLSLSLSLSHSHTQQ